MTSRGSVASAMRRWAWLAGTPARLLFVGMIRLYRVTIGPLGAGRCRFYPSCSVYAEKSIGELGVVRGVPLTMWRVARCSPLSRGGVDYPPSPRRMNGEYDAIVQPPGTVELSR